MNERWQDRSLPQKNQLIRSQVFRRTRVVICVTHPVAEQAQPSPETVNPASVTPAGKEDKADDDGDSDSTQVLDTPNAEEVRKASVEKTVEDAAEPEAGFEWYVPIA